MEESDCWTLTVTPLLKRHIGLGELFHDRGDGGGTLDDDGAGRIAGGEGAGGAGGDAALIGDDLLALVALDKGDEILRSVAQVALRGDVERAADGVGAVLGRCRAVASTPSTFTALTELSREPREM